MKKPIKKVSDSEEIWVWWCSAGCMPQLFSTGESAEEARVKIGHGQIDPLEVKP